MRKIIVIFVSILSLAIIKSSEYNAILNTISKRDSTDLKCSRWRRRYDNDDDDADDDDESESRLRIAPGSTGEGSPT